MREHAGGPRGVVADDGVHAGRGRGVRARTARRPRGGAADACLLAFFALAVGFALVGQLVPLDSVTSHGMGFEAPSATHVLGTDELGRDVLARTLHGGAALLGVALVSTLVSTLTGVALGCAISGHGLASRAVSLAVDVLVVLPSVLVMMVLVFGMGAGVTTMAVVMTVVTAPYLARYTRSLARPVLASDYVTLARLAGDALPLVMVRDVLPAIALPLATDTGQRFISAVYLVASASFLGFDPLGSGADWGTMIQAGLSGLSLNPWSTLAPTIALACVTVSGNLLVDRLGRRGEL